VRVGRRVEMTERGPAVWCPACGCGHLFNAAATPTRKGESWTWNGDGDLPTFLPSMHVYVEMEDGSKKTVCHSFVTAGAVQFLGDCAHAMANQKAELPDWPEGAPC